ncbi:MAG: radical SAM protein [Candidatus Omnitrophica bacterium]|nr:radical SAM protein [Candidatus Omnitrophota bacterium]MBU4590164.1 radical SAM protein [Candidatus Omnitrophota bacterium]
MDELKIDSHKLMYHVDRVNRWQRGEDIFPIYLEIAPYGGCNHRCIFCALDYIGYKPISLDAKVLAKTLRDAVRCGVESVMYAGEGEPLMHKEIISIVNLTRKTGLDVAITTNGVFLDDQMIKKCLKDLSWIRVSFNAGSARTYEKIHKSIKGDFKKALSNLKNAVKYRHKLKLDCTIGVQMVLIPENRNEVIKLANIIKEIGGDYLIIKPFSRHPMSHNAMDEGFDYSRFLYLDKRLKGIATDDFKIIFRSHTMRKLGKDKPYAQCLGLPFWAYIDAEGDVYACSSFLKDRRFLYGNIYKDSFEKIWRGRKRKKIMNMMQNGWDIKECREVCRLDEINRYLWNLKNPSSHANFI